ncbi:hypothetical protein [Halostella sp. PRR32]|uniref:hypothetical protein n=1 Tax=Halostella sp. PRR32 TaxID=3098147 RepID=UPI002B1D62AC|nr:hypothetical protein [Halostella sp. PRR32]
MQGGLEDTAPHEYGVTTTSGPSTTNTDQTDDSQIASWLSSVNLSAQDVTLLSSALNVLATGMMLLSVGVSVWS